MKKEKKPSLCIWIMGMPGSGKSTLAAILYEELSRIAPVILLEADALRKEKKIAKYGYR